MAFMLKEYIRAYELTALDKLFKALYILVDQGQSLFLQDVPPDFLQRNVVEVSIAWKVWEA